MLRKGNLKGNGTPKEGQGWGIAATQGGCRSCLEMRREISRALIRKFQPQANWTLPRAPWCSAPRRIWNHLWELEKALVLKAPAQAADLLALRWDLGIEIFLNLQVTMMHNMDNYKMLEPPEKSLCDKKNLATKLQTGHSGSSLVRRMSVRVLEGRQDDR